MQTVQGAPDIQREAADILARRREMLDLARSAAQTPFDYIIVGSGAGGGPLAARLAEAGKRVLLLEAGSDPALDKPQGGDPLSYTSSKPAAVRDVLQVPGYHAAATEDDAMSWGFSVRHYDDASRQRADSKYSATKDPSAAGGVGKGGIFYPRSSGIGGCTGHYAMIVVRPNDRDWNRIAALTGDVSWRAENMQGYFTRIENCLYYTRYQGFLRRILFFYEALMRALTFINPRMQLDRGGHGSLGWQKTSFIDLPLIFKIAKGDRTFRSVLWSCIFALLRRKGQFWALLRAVGDLRIVQYLDPNFGTDRQQADARLAFIPIGTDGRNRVGLRERLLDTAEKNPLRLVVLTGVLANRVIFQQRTPDGPPTAVGIEVEEGLHLYEASPLAMHAPPTAPRAQYFTRGEVILAGGSFNTPQLLMLSGIGPADHLRGKGIAGLHDEAGELVGDIVDLQGVGQNLQDRYEVSVISEVSEPFSTLNGISFRPDDSADPARQQWQRTGEGLYTTNGGALAFFKKTSRAPADTPDLFIFGAPAAFRGYYWGWSRELLSKYKGAPATSRNLWSWILLEAYTDNNGGHVSLRSSSPREQPQIIFRSFSEGPSGYVSDLTALAEGVEFVREVNTRIKIFGTEIQPGAALGDNSNNLRSWICNEAWGHHACGTCRIGSDSWQADVNLLKDRGAVLDSRFRVHGVSGLRVVDASVFPSIPGYFIVTPIFMVSEKAADDLLADSKEYPQQLAAAETRAIMLRRSIEAGLTPAQAAEQSAANAAATAVSISGTDPGLPTDTVGLALSGGGIRSATFCLGVLQALAKRDRLRHIDFLSTVSGGGYIGAFLGRLYSRLRTLNNPIGRVRDILKHNDSAEIWWLRSHAKYLKGEGRSDLRADVGAVWRNLISVHVVIGTLFIAILAALRWVGERFTPFGGQPAWASSWVPVSSGGLSPWWWIPLALLLGGVFPAWLGYWLTPIARSQWNHPPLALFTWLAALAAAAVAIIVTGTVYGPLLGIVALLAAWVWQEAARWHAPQAVDESSRGAVARNRLTSGLGSMLTLLVGSVLWVILDTLARQAASLHYSARFMPWIVGAITTVAALLPGFRAVAAGMTKITPSGAFLAGIGKRLQGGAIAFALLAFLIFALDAITHYVFNTSALVGVWVLICAAVISLIIGRASTFANRSSLQALYEARLTRTYLGATNNARVHAAGDLPRDVGAAHPDDDLFFHEYHPERSGGPLHLLNVCVNETVDVVSGRQLSADKGLSMCVGPEGVSVGLRFHALWDEKGALRAAPVSSAPDSFHVLADKDEPLVNVEPLRLGQWTSISGASFTTGEGRFTTLAMSLLAGLFNVRLGYWWNTRIKPGNRPGLYPPSFLQRLKSAPGYLLNTQRTILNEWRGYFAGPSRQFWYLSDGGHFENTGLYELIRRRVPLMLAIQADEDADYGFDSMGLLACKARLDFGAEFHWVDPTVARQAGQTGWQAMDAVTGTAPVPAWIRNWIQPDAIGPLAGIAQRGPYAAALAAVCYGSETQPTSWLVMLKACLPAADMPLDLRSYAAANGLFPNQSTLDQNFSDDQWESYRLLGELLTVRLLV
jgi:choline dehydrogenase-like flavoprotein